MATFLDKPLHILPLVNHAHASKHALKLIQANEAHASKSALKLVQANEEESIIDDAFHEECDQECDEGDQEHDVRAGEDGEEEELPLPPALTRMISKPILSPLRNREHTSLEVRYGK